MDDQRKDHIYSKGPRQMNHPEQLQTHNLPTNDVGNTNSRNKGNDLLLVNKPRFIPWRTERMSQRIQRHSRVTLDNYCLCIRDYTPETTLTDYVHREKREEVNLAALKTALTHPYADSKTTDKSTKEDWLPPSEMIVATRWKTEWH